RGRGRGRPRSDRPAVGRRHGAARAHGPHRRADDRRRSRRPPRHGRGVPGRGPARTRHCDVVARSDARRARGPVARCRAGPLMVSAVRACRPRRRARWRGPATEPAGARERRACAVAARHACGDSETVLRLREAFRPELEDHQLLGLLEQVEVPLIAVLVEMEWRGVRVDLERLREISRQFSLELAELEGAIYRAAGTEFNINSTPQLRHVLFEKHQLPVLKKTKTGASTDYDVLEQLAAMGHEVPRLLIEYRELSKLKSTYIDALPGFINPRTGRIHTSYNQAGAATGRLSSSDPNLQNIPVRTPRGEAIRRAFVAAPGWLLLTADYSQI